MTKINVEIHEDLITIISKIRAINDMGIELVIPKGAVILESSLNLKLLKKLAEDENKEVHFTTEDTSGQYIINQIEEKELEEVTQLTDMQELVQESTGEPEKKLRNKFIFPRRVALVKPKRGIALLLVLLTIGALGVFAAVKGFQQVHTASINVYIETQPLTKSTQVKVISNQNTDSTQSILKGTKVETLVTKTESLATTGEKIVGEKATGEIKIFNKKTVEVELKKGHKFEYDDLAFTLNDNVKITAATEDPVTLVVTPGDATAKVTAAEIGSASNIEKDEDLSVDDYKKDEVVARSIKDFTGGSSKAVKVVAEKDITELEKAASENINKTAEEELAKIVTGDRKYIRGSIVTTTTLKEYSHKVDEETETLELELGVTAAGLAYSQRDLEGLMDNIAQSFVPAGHVLLDNQKSIETEVLGQTETSKLSADQADLQVTLRTYITTNIDVEKLKDQLKGQNINKAKEILDGISNVKSYAIQYKPNIGFINFLPTMKDKIEINISKE